MSSEPPQLDTSASTEWLVFALNMAQEAADVIMPHYQRCAVERKPDGTEVTAADRAAEERIRERIDHACPDHGVLGEEFGHQQPRSRCRLTWVIDPIDGTTSFALGLPLFGTLIALLEDDEPVLGVVSLPALGETVYAARGHGCWWKRAADTKPERLRVADSVRVDSAFCAATGPHATDILNPAERPRYRLSRLVQASKQFRFVTDCVQHLLVCRGRIHLAIDQVMSPWDIAALVPCVEEAGGAVATIQGRRERIVFGGSLLSACDRQLIEAAVSIMGDG